MKFSFKNAQTSMFFFGVVMVGQGLLLVVVPNFLLALLGIEDARDYWVRFVGVALLILSIYYIRSGFENLTSFFYSTVIGRTVQFILILILFFVYKFSIILVGFSLFEFFTGLWTFYCLRIQKRTT